MKDFIKRHPFIVLILGLGILILFQKYAVMPLVYDVVKSDAFLIESKDQGSRLPISNEMTAIAFMQCNSYIKSELDSDTAVTFASKPYKAWGMGNYQYLINGDINIADSSGKMTNHRYVCRIAYDNGDNMEGVQDLDNWSIVGLSGIDGI